MGRAALMSQMVIRPSSSDTAMRSPTGADASHAYGPCFGSSDFRLPSTSQNFTPLRSVAVTTVRRPSK